MPNSLERRHNRRRRHERTRQELISAALEQAVAGSFKDLTVEGITREAGVSRSAFYVYFGDKEELLLGALEDLIGDQRERLGKCWADGPDPRRALEVGLHDVAGTYGAHADLLGLAFETATYDEEVRELWMALLETVTETTSGKITELQRKGDISASLDAAIIAEGLVLMADRSFQINLSRGAETAQAAASAVNAIWQAALFGPAPGESASASEAGAAASAGAEPISD